MRSRSSLAFPLFVALALTPLPVVGAAREAQIDAAAAHQRFEAVAPFLDEPGKAAEMAVHGHCLTLNRRCLAFADTHADVILATVPDNPEFWTAYDLLLTAGPVPVEILEFDDLPAFSGFIAATNGWARRELVTRRLADARRLHTLVMAHRRRLGASNLLIDKMIFTATTGILLPAINVYMANTGVHETDPGGSLLDEMLRPLTQDELSLRRVMDGERRYAASRLDEVPAGGSPVGLDDLQRMYDFIAERSEAGWEDFWRHGLDILANVEVPPDSYLHTRSWADYVVNVRYLDASLGVLRALREMYEGRISPGPPAGRAPYGWTWRWEEASQTLCLDAGYLHASVSAAEPPSICHQHLTTSDPRVGAG